MYTHSYMDTHKHTYTLARRYIEEMRPTKHTANREEREREREREPGRCGRMKCEMHAYTVHLDFDPRPLFSLFLSTSTTPDK